MPRTTDGRPDLQGVWGNNSVTPMTRPRQWKDKTTLTDAELNELKALGGRRRSMRAGTPSSATSSSSCSMRRDRGKYDQVSYDPSTGNYNQFWMAEREWDHRTSLIIDPPDGQFPPLTPEAEARARPQTRRGRAVPADGPEDRPLSERCISYGAPRTQSNYNSYVQIIQSKDTVVLLQEMIHDARVVPDDRASRTCRPGSGNCTATRAGAGKATRSSSRPRTT